MIQSISGSVTIPLRVMIFIDAGYFMDHWLEKECKIPKMQYNFRQFSIRIANNGFTELKQPRLIRTYYYDGLPDLNYTDELTKRKKFHDRINRLFGDFEVRTARLVKNNHHWEQKGVDTIIALDMVEKAVSNQYDVAILVSGDLDHLPAVKSVKNLGKHVYGVYYEASYSEPLINEFDLGYQLEKIHDGEELKMDENTKEVTQT